MIKLYSRQSGTYGHDSQEEGCQPARITPRRVALLAETPSFHVSALSIDFSNIRILTVTFIYFAGTRAIASQGPSRDLPQTRTLPVAFGPREGAALPERVRGAEAGRDKQ
jgi:hypothetical protein